MTNSTKLRILAIDVETSPNQAYVWGLWNQNIGINQIIEPGRVICFSAQWEGSKSVIFKSEYHDGRPAMLQALWELMDSADVLMHFNGTTFDVPWCLGELADAGFKPPSPFHQIDLLKHFRKNTRYPSKKLAFVSDRVLGGDTKLETGGFQLWRDCIEEDVDPEVKRKAWARMKRYSVKDSRLLWQVYEAVKGWVKLPVPMVLSEDGEDRCRCGSADIQWRGWAYTTAYRYRRFQCNECGAWGRSAKSTANNGSTRQL